MSARKGVLHIAASVARTFKLWPFIARTGAFNRARRRKYPDTIVHLDVVITECCSLRCRDCSNLMQYYHHPENLDGDVIIKSLGRILSAMKVEQLKILGGEPFVWQKVLIQLLDYLKNEACGRVNEIDLITNGTIIPSDECISLMKSDPRIKVVFSNYGDLSSKLTEFSSICERKGIRYDVVGDDTWWDFGAPVKHDEEDKKTQHRYDGCYSRRLCTTLYRGKLYVCPRQAHAIRLGLIAEDNTENVNISDPLYSDPAMMHDAIYRLMDRKEYISTCKYCACDKGVKVPRAVQAERPLDVS